MMADAIGVRSVDVEFLEGPADESLRPSTWTDFGIPPFPDQPEGACQGTWKGPFLY